MPRKKVLLDPVKARVGNEVRQLQRNREDIRTLLATATALFRESLDKIPLTTSLLDVLNKQRKALDMLEKIAGLLGEAGEDESDGADQGDEQTQADGQ